MEKLIEECTLRNYSKKTIQTYLHYNQHFLKMVKKKPLEVTQKDIRWYLGVLIRWKRSPATVNLAHNALQFYYGQILKRKFYDIPFQKNPESVKETLNQQELKSLIDVTTNPKHKLMISMLYATGVRVSELIKIRVDHMDLTRKLLLVKAGKGNKDRYTILSDNVVNQIQDYPVNKNNYLFPTPNGHITAATVRAVLQNAKKKAKLTKKVTPHILRHSFATHLKESGTQDLDIKKLLGHKSLKTTQTYAHVNVNHLRNIKNPHDTF